jgi:hypothetical protein
VAEGSFVPDPSDFSERLILWNGLRDAGFASWEFLPGMRFAERSAWWRNGGDRAGRAHEGLDISFYRIGDGSRLSLGAGARIPVVYAGEVVSVVQDFLGSSLFVAHARRDSRGRQLHTVYGHILPLPGLAPGILIGDGDAVGAIADTSGRKSPAPPHLHITLALIDRQGGPERLDWAAMGEKSRVLLLDPMMMMKQ